MTAGAVDCHAHWLPPGLVALLRHRRAAPRIGPAPGGGEHLVTFQEALPFDADQPFGLFGDSTYRVHDMQLLPGDRLLLVTDGMIERNAARLDIPAELIATPDLHARETVQHLIRRVAAHGDLQDDATVLCLDWHGHQHTLRDPNTGSDPEKASAPS